MRFFPGCGCCASPTDCSICPAETIPATDLTVVLSGFVDSPHDYTANTTGFCNPIGGTCGSFSTDRPTSAANGTWTLTENAYVPGSGFKNWSYGPVSVATNWTMVLSLTCTGTLFGGAGSIGLLVRFLYCDCALSEFSAAVAPTDPGVSCGALLVELADFTHLYATVGSTSGPSPSTETATGTAAEITL